MNSLSALLLIVAAGVLAYGALTAGFWIAGQLIGAIR